jgi:hypothetical protein
MLTTRFSGAWRTDGVALLAALKARRMSETIQ